VFSVKTTAHTIAVPRDLHATDGADNGDDDSEDHLQQQNDRFFWPRQGGSYCFSHASLGRIAYFGAFLLPEQAFVPENIVQNPLKVHLHRAPFLRSV
jgi:hypothetical protein